MQPQPQPFASPPQVGAQSRQVTPSGWWHVLGAALIAIGIVGGSALIISAVVRVTDRVESFQRVDVPGSSTLHIDGTGGYTVYHEYSGANSDSLAPQIDVEITAPDGSEVRLSSYTADVTYAFGGHEGQARYSFDVREPGDYQVTTEGDSRGTIAVGRGLGGGLVGPIVAGLLLGFFGVVAGIVVIVVVAVKRGRSRRDQFARQSGWGSPYPYSGAYPSSGPPGPAPPPPSSPPYPSPPQQF